jgi:hypothetical protein
MTLNETLKKYNSTVIKVTEVIVNKEYAEMTHEFIGTPSEAKKFYLKIALENRNRELTYAEDIRKFNLEQLIWFVFGGYHNMHNVSINFYVNDFTRKVNHNLLTAHGEWNAYIIDREGLNFDGYVYSSDFYYDNLMG